LAVVDLAGLKSGLAPGARLIGLDLGEKTIGLALSDTRLTVATPLETLKRSKFTNDAVRLEALIAEHGIGGMVIGLPLNMDGRRKPRAPSDATSPHARHFPSCSGTSGSQPRPLPAT